MIEIKLSIENIGRNRGATAKVVVNPTNSMYDGRLLADVLREKAIEALDSQLEMLKTLGVI